MAVDSIDGVAHCEAEFSNWGDNLAATGFTWFDRSVLEFGKDFVVRIGSATVFDGRIMALEGALSRMRRRRRSWSAPKTGCRTCA